MLYGRDWDYRVYHSQDGYCFIRAVYKENGTLNIEEMDYWPEHARASSVKDLELDLERMAEALNKPVLTEGDTNVEVS